MSKIYAGANNVARQVEKIYVGVNGVARRVIGAYVGDADGIARKVLSLGTMVHIPTMTSATEPSGSTDRSTYYQDSATYAAWHAFDKNDSKMWQSKAESAGSNTRWVRYNFPYQIIPTSVYVYNYVSNNAYGFVIEAKNESDSAYDVLVDCSSNSGTVNTTYSISSNKQYSQFRYRCTGGSGRVGVYEMDVWGISLS